MVEPKLAMVPQHFSRLPDRGFTVPHDWQSESCIIEIDMHTAADEDTLRFFDIAVQTSLLSIHCVAKPPHFGGTAFVGSKKVMNVTIHGSSTSSPSTLEVKRGVRINNVSIAID